MMLPIAEWRPDVSDLNGQVTGDVNNVLCADGSYKPFPQLTPLSSQLDGLVTGSFVAKSSQGQTTIFVGTDSNLWRYDGATQGWDDVSRPSNSYSSTLAERWQFAQYGDIVVAVHANTPPQKFTLGASANFSDLGGSPPNARCVAVWGDFLALGNLLNDPNVVKWSGLNDPEDWSETAFNGGSQYLPDGGVVQGITSSTNPIVFQERAIQQMVFVPGSAQTFSRNKLYDQRGMKSRYSLAYRGEFVFFYADDGFYQIDYNGGIAAIGSEKVNRYFDGYVPPADLPNVLGAVDPVHTRVYWACNSGQADGYDTILIYDWNLQRWSRADVDLVSMTPAAPPGYTLEQLSAIYPILEDVPFSLDSRVWLGGALVLAGLTPGGRLGFFTGDSKEATYTTQEMGDTSGFVTRVKDPMPIVDANDLWASIGTRMRRGDQVVWSAEARVSGNTGIARKIRRARFCRVKVRIPKNTTWTHATGVDITTSQAGMR